MKAYQVLAKPEAWTRGAYARLADGSSAPFSCHPDAVAFCAAGAIFRAYRYGESFDSETRAFNRLVNYLHERDLSIAAWNDNPNTTHDDVVNLLRQLDI